MKLLSILICTLESRYALFNDLIAQLSRQTHYRADKIEILFDRDQSMSIGAKRNSLLNRSTGKYIAFIDDDDAISDNYIDLLMEGIDKGVDCCSLKGMYSVDGINDGIFEHSLKYGKWRTVDILVDDFGNKWPEIKYERYPNHLNCIKADIAKQFKFPETNFGEDHDWSKQLHESGLIKTEYYIDQVIYFYRKISVARRM